MREGNSYKKTAEAILAVYEVLQRELPHNHPHKYEE
jgi:hypothetical protein